MGGGGRGRAAPGTHAPVLRAPARRGNVMRRFSNVCALCAVLLLPALSAVTAPSATGSPRVMQGPRVMAVTMDTIPVWVRLSGEFPVMLEYDTDPAFSGPRRTEAVTPSKQGGDLCAVLRMTGLSAASACYYRILVNGKPDPYLKQTWQARTAPAGPAKFSLCFGSCPRVQLDPVQPVWYGIAEVQPDLFFWIGDNIYGDTLDPEILAEEYRRQLYVASLLPFQASVPQLAVWDDHDFGLNDHDRTNPIREQALEVFKRYWPNPAHGLPDTPGVFFKYAYGGVDFFFLDDRYHRDPNAAPDTPEKTMLGAGQLAWLREGLAGSTAPFKVLVSGSGWTSAKGAGGDSWASFIHERDALFDFIRDRNITGVLLLSGDTHVGEFNAIPRSAQGGYDLYDLVSSPLAQTANTNWRERHPELRVRTPYEGVNAGLVEFDLTAAPPTVRMNLIDREGRTVWRPVTLTADDLRNGVATAAEKAEK